MAEPSSASRSSGAARDVAWITLGFAAFAGLLTATNYRLSGDSPEYLSLARHVAEGKGYTRLGQFEVYRQPGYPFITAFFALFTSDIELAGHIAALVCGALCVPATWWAARAVVSERTAVIAAALLALNAFFADGASCALSEMSCALFAILALGALWRASSRNVAWSAAFGAFVAGAYLCRSETILLLPLGAIVLALRKRVTPSSRVVVPVFAVIALVLVCAPFWLALREALGHFSLGGNSVNLIWYQSDAAQRPPASLDPRWAPRELDPRWTLVTHPADFQPARYAALNWRELSLRLARNGAGFVSPALSMLYFGLGAALLVLGVVALRRTDRARWLAIAVVPFVPMIALPFRDGTTRLLLPYLPAASVAMAVGFASVLDSDVLARWLGPRGTRRRAWTCALVLAVGPALKHARHIGRPEEAIRQRYRAVGAAIRARTPAGVEPVVMADNTFAGLHARGETMAFPARADLDTVVGQMRRFGARFLVATREHAEQPEMTVQTTLPVEGTRELALVDRFPGSVDLYELRE